jgi:DNA modification methylase
MIFPYPKDNLWRNYLVKECEQHGARMNMPMLLDLVPMYSKPGDYLLDPMGGVGSLFAALTLNRDVCIIEVEKWIADLARRNLANIKEKYPCEGRGVVIQGDTRKILPMPIDIDLIFFSPPYGDIERKTDEAEQKLIKDKFSRTTAQGWGDVTAQGYGENPDQLGNLPYQKQRWEMARIYKKCFDTLTAGKLMIVVTKDIIRNYKRIPIGKGTIQSCLEVGFELEDHHTRTCQITGMQALHCKDPKYEPVTEEDVYVFRRR